MKSQKVDTKESISHEPDESNSSSLSTKVFYIALIYISFLLCGIFEETIYKTQYEITEKKIKFKDPMISLFLVSIISCVISFTGILINQRNLPKDISSPIKTTDKIILGSYYLISRYTSEYSLQYLDYIVKIIGKSCKSVAIILITALYNVPFIGVVFQKMINQKDDNKKQSATAMDWFKVVITTVSVVLFNYSPSASSQASALEGKVVLVGYCLLIISLLCDGLLSLKEKIINNDIHTNPKLKEYRKIMNWEYMFIFSITTSVTTICALGYSFAFSDISSKIGEYIQSTELIRNLICYAILNSFGQAVLFIFLEKYGPLTLSLITSVRKILTIALSIILFKKPISVIQGISLFLAGALIVIEVLDKQDHKKKQQ